MGRLVGWGGLLLALAIGAAVRFTPLAQVEDLRPRPDALEYEEAARTLVEGDGYALILDGGRYPPRYPPGFSLLIAPVMWLTDGRHGAGVWVVLVAALAGIAAVWAIGRLTGGPWSAATAALLLACAPLHVRWSRAVMADVPAATLVTLVALGGLLALRRAARAPAWFALGALAGAASIVRPACVVIVFPLAVLVLARRQLRNAVALAAGVVAGVAPLELYELVRFGSPLASGYGYWAPADYFAWRYVFGPPAAGGEGGNLVFYLRQLVGLVALYPWPIALLAAAGFALALRRRGAPRRLAWLTAGTAVALLALHLPFFWQWDRFLLPLLPLVLALAALCVGAGAPGRLRIAGAALVAVALAGAWLTPSAFDPPDPPTEEVAALRAIAARVERDAALIARADVLLVSRLFHDDTDRLWMPIERCEHRALIRAGALRPYAAEEPQTWVWDAVGPPFDPATLEAGIRALLAAGRPVYFAPILGNQTPLVAEVHRLLATRFALRPAPTTTATGLVRVLPPPDAAQVQP
jgi:4-amino-4-deoxy-L-arabinose transferase-like glycosyltransferase